jgi:hypothetical protein
MIIIGIVLSFVGLAYLCWLLFALAVYALPFFAGLTAGLAAFHSGSGPIGAIVVGAIAGAITLLLGQIAFTTFRSPLIRAAITLLFAVPAAAAGYHAALGLAHIAIPTEGWRDAIAVIGAIIVAATAWVRMALFLPPERRAWRCCRPDVAWSVSVADQRGLNPPFVALRCLSGRSL